MERSNLKKWITFQEFICIYKYRKPTINIMMPIKNESVANTTVENNDRMKNDDTETRTSTDHANP